MRYAVTLSTNDADKLRGHLDGPNWAHAVSDLDQWLRAKVKYEDLPEAVSDAYQAARDQLRSILDGWGLTLE